MIAFRPYRPEDLRRLELQPAQARWRDGVAVPGYAESLAVDGLAWSAVTGERVLGCAGLAPAWKGRAIAWALLGEIPRRDWPAVVRRMQAALRDAEARGFRRVEAQVAKGFGDGCRLVRLLGFEVEALMPSFLADGGDAFLYSRVAR